MQQKQTEKKAKSTVTNSAKLPVGDVMFSPGVSSGSGFVRICGAVLAGLALIVSAMLLIFAGPEVGQFPPLFYQGAGVSLLVVLVWCGLYWVGLESRVRGLKRILNRQLIMIAGLRSYEELHKAVIESIPDGLLFVFDEEFRFLLAEGGGMVQLRLEPEDLMGRTPAEVFSQGVADDMRPHMQKALDGGISSLEIAYWERTMHLRMLPLKNSGTVHAGLMVGQDVTADRRNAKALAEGKRRLSTLISNMPGMVYRCVYNDQRTIEFVSDGCLSLAGYTPSEMVLNREVSWQDIIHPDDIDSLRMEYSNALEEERPYMLSYRINTRDGEQKWVSERGVFIPLEPKGLVMMEGIVMDITAHRQAEDQAKQREQQLMQADRLASLGTMVAGVAHEINNPNTVISLNAPMLEVIMGDALPLLDELYKQGREFKLAGTDWLSVQNEIMPLLDKVKSSSRRIRSIVSELKGFARQEEREQRELVDLVDVIRAAAELVESKISQSTNQFSLLPDGGNGVVLGDFQRLEQVVVNVLINACDALLSIDQGIEVRLEREGTMVHILVRDDGQGMDADVLSHALDPFFSTKHSMEGTGLGLAISHSIIEQHGGTIRFESEAGQGTLCRISLPLAESAASSEDAIAGRR